VRRVRNRNKVCVGAAFQFSATFGDGGRRQGLANGLRSELGEYTPQRADAWRERVAIGCMASIWGHGRRSAYGL
jgi:hypothetical protein